jgi:hypothetical protein
MPPKTETSAAAESLWPLPLTPFEVYYHLDDSPEFPTTFPVLLRFTGTLDRDRFAGALARAVARHPLLRARIEKRGGKPCWVAAGDTPHLNWADASVAPPTAANDYLDLTAGPGLQTWVRAAPDAAQVVFQFHHACCDGLAALQFIQDVLALYRADADDSLAEASLRPLDANLLRGRGTIGTDEPREPKPLQGLRDAWYTLKVWSAILFRSPSPLASPRGARLKDRQLLEFEIATLSSDETAALRRSAVEQGATTNDLVIRDLLVVLRDWNRREASNANANGDAGRLRINVPVSVRMRAEANMPAANRIGYAFVTDEGTSSEDPGQLLGVVREETRRIKEWKLALYFLGGLAFASVLPGVIGWAMRRKRCFATAVLSNVGRYFPDPAHKHRGERWQCGDLTLQWIGGVPPVRQLTSAAVIVIEYAGETSFCLRTDPCVFDMASTRRLLHELVEQVRKTIRG